MALFSGVLVLGCELEFLDLLLSDRESSLRRDRQVNEKGRGSHFEN